MATNITPPETHGVSGLPVGVSLARVPGGPRAAGLAGVGVAAGSSAGLHVLLSDGWLKQREVKLQSKVCHSFGDALGSPSLSILLLHTPDDGR